KEPRYHNRQRLGELPATNMGLGVCHQLQQLLPKWLARGKEGRCARGRGPSQSGLKRLVAIVTVASASAAAPAAAKPTIRFRTGFIDVQRSAVEIPAIQLRDSAVRFRIGGHFDKSEPSGLAGIPVGD